VNEIQVFNFKGNDIRTVKVEGETWWVLKDVCDVLGLTSPHKVAERLDTDEKGRSLIPTLGGEQEVVIINESGLYNVILRSDKPETREFKRWVTHEVLPTIRKTGAYMTPETIEKVLADPDTIIKLATEIKTLRAEAEKQKALNAELTVQNQLMAPKADYFDQLVERNLLTNFRETAKELEIREKDFINFLLDKRYIYRDKRGKLLPTAEKNDGLFEVKECFNEKTQWSGTQTLITPRGRETFRLLCKGL
jgi:prophage antirepressor-like protein